MKQMFPLVGFYKIDNSEADKLLREWCHWLGGCNRPFGRQSFAVDVCGKGAVSIAVSASTVNATCGGYDRQSVVELARLCSHPNERWATRVCLRLWREVGAPLWPYWEVKALVSYANNNRHTGDVYRFDGWKKVAEVAGGVAGGGWQRGKRYEEKSVWSYKLSVD